MNEDEVAKAYDIVLKALEDEDFKKWLNTDTVKENLGFDYDQYATHLHDNSEEPLGYEIWALRRYLEMLDVPEGITVITLRKENAKEDVEKLSNALEDALGE